MRVDTNKAEPVSVPSYEDFCEMQDDDSDWWHWLLEDHCEWLFEERGIRIDPKEIAFDLYRRECSSTGAVYDEDKFIKYYADELMSASPVLTAILSEGMESVRWGNSHRNCNVSFSYGNDYAGYGYSFNQGLFAGLDFDEMISAEPTDNHNAWYVCVEGIIEDVHSDIIKALECEDEYRKSKEEYEEWLKSRQ